MTTKRCPACGNFLDDLGFCRPCRAARSRRWYSETSSVASARRGLTAKLKRRFDPVQRDALLAAITGEQRGFCACCGEEAERVPLSLDWSLDQMNDEGLPLFRGALCRSCKIAVGRVMVPSQFTLVPKTLARVERYLERPWRDPAVVLAQNGVMAPRRNIPAEIADRETEARMARTESTMDFLASIGVGVGS